MAMVKSPSWHPLVKTIVTVVIFASFNGTAFSIEREQRRDRFDDSVAAIDDPAREVAGRAVDSIAIIYSSGLCTGALVASDLVLTAWHCVNKLRSTIVKWRSGADATQGWVVAIDKEHDLAILKLARKSERAPLPISRSDLPLLEGTTGIVIGHPRGDFYTVKTGRAIRPDEDFFLIDAEVDVGNSGGPVLDQNGEIIGVVIILNRFIGNRQLGDAVSRKPIRHLMEVAEDRQVVSVREAEPTIGIDIGGGQDPLLDELVGPNYGSFYYGLSYDLYDRIHFGFSHLTMRPERVWGYQLGYAFKSPLLDLIPFFGANFYEGDRSVFAQKVGVKVELLFVDLTLSHLRHDGRSYWSYALSF